MYPKHTKFALWPAVVPAHQTATITVVACDNVYLPTEGVEYTLRINPLNADAVDYHTAPHRIDYPVIGKNGVLTLDYAFGEEGEYWVDLLLEGKVLQKMRMYALEEDLYGLRPLKGDLHSHSHRSDGKHDPAALAGHYREQGYDFFALTDHNRYYPSQEAQDAFKDVKIGLTILNGEEVHTPESVVHLVHVGGTRSVSEIYINDPARYEKEYKELQAALPDTIEEQYKERYAEAQWATREMHNAGGVAILAHPFWRPKNSRAYNETHTFATHLLQSGFFDAFEMIGGQDWDGNNMATALWNDLRVQGLTLPIVGSSDNHCIDVKHFAYLYTIVLAKENTQEAILDAIRKGNTIAVEVNGTEENTRYHCYGSLRMVTYGLFLVQHYFPCTKRIAEGEGVMMRRYLIGAEDGALLSACAGRVDTFYRRYFGLEAPPIPTPAILEQAQKWRKVHLASQSTKGGTLIMKPDGSNKRQD